MVEIYLQVEMDLRCTGDVPEMHLLVEIYLLVEMDLRIPRGMAIPPTASERRRRAGEAMRGTRMVKRMLVGGMGMEPTRLEPTVRVGGDGLTEAMER